MKQNTLQIDGLIQEALGSGRFKVIIYDNKIVICHLSGKIRMNYIKIIPGDKVRIEISPYDLTKGRIIYRYK